MNDFFTAGRVTAGYGRQIILNGLDFTLSDGEITGILGSNGCGKSTLMKAIIHDIPYKGCFTLDGRILSEIKGRKLGSMISYVPQKSGISISMPVMDVVMMGFNPDMHLLQNYSAVQFDKAYEAMKIAGVYELRDRDYLSLSEGQKQLCIMARTIVEDARLLLLDEPESALDFRHRYELISLLKRMVTPKRAALICLHDTNLALRLCDNILLMRDGRIEDSIRPAADSYEVVYNALSKIYGNITLIETAGNYVMSWGCNDTSGHVYDAGTVYDEYMASGKKHLIVTGAIGSGKTTLLRNILKETGINMPGLITKAISENCVAIYDNVSGNVGIIGKYMGGDGRTNKMQTVQSGFDNVAIPAIKRALSDEKCKYFVMDEIGYLEQSHDGFKEALLNLWDSKCVMAVVRGQHIPFLDDIKNRDDVFVINMDGDKL